MHDGFIAGNSRRLVFQGLALVMAAFLVGCHGAGSKKDANAQAGPVVFKGAADMTAAEDFYLAQEWKKAQKLFEKVADDTANPPLYAEKARFYEAECARMQGEYVDAMSTYNRMLIDFQMGVFREQAVREMFRIADFWLDDSRAQLKAQEDKAAGKKVSVPWNFVHFSKFKPLVDEEGHALKMLEQVYFNDPTGPYADKSLFLAGFIQFQRGNFREADTLLSQLIINIDRNGKPSKYRDQAIKLAIMAKNNSTGGPWYDGRKAGESLKLINAARATSPELAAQGGKFLDDQASMIRHMQAEKDFEIAEFYWRTGRPAAAWFYYELVRRRYDNTEYHDRAVARMKEINADLTAQQTQPAIAKATRREWQKWVWGHEMPMLAENAKVPPVPGEPVTTPAPSNPNNPAPIIANNPAPNTGVKTVSNEQLAPVANGQQP